MEDNKIIDIFDTNNIEDLPELSRKRIKLSNFKGNTLKVIDLFELKNTLSVNEVIVSLYRLHKLEKTKGWVHTTLNNLQLKETIKRIDKGLYQKI